MSTSPVPALADLEVPLPSWSDGPAAEHARPRSERTRRRLLMAAAEHFHTHGYEATSLRDILTSTGLAKGGLYFHFRSKAAMAEALILELEASWRLAHRELDARPLDPLWLLVVETEMVLEHWSYDPVACAASRVLRETARPGDVAQRWTRRWLARIEAPLARAREQGLLHADIEPARLAPLVQAMTAGQHELPDLVPERPTLRDRTSRTLDGLLGVVAEETWLVGYRASGWHDRPQHDPDDYARARAW